MRRIKECLCQYFLLLVFTVSLTAALLERAQGAEPLNYFQVDGRYDYRTELLKLALSYTEHAPQLIPRPDIPTARATKLMEKGKINGVISVATSRDREQKLLAIKIPILAGILGMRVFFIHKNDQTDFSDIKTLNDLQTKVAGFGEHWGDLTILKENNLPVEPVAKYPSLFEMLNAKRFDYFPRGINEIFGEHTTFKKSAPNLAIEQDLAIFYPYPVYFFVAKDNLTLAKIIETGLKQALDDGKLKTLFLHYHSDLLAELNFNQRRVFYLTNSLLSEDAVVKNMHWWFDESR